MTFSRKGRRSRLAGAFTLIEMIAVLIILSVLVALVAPGMARIYQNVKLDTSVRSFKAFVASARQQAALRRSPCRLVIQPGWREMGMEIQEADLIGSPKEAVEYIKRVEAPVSDDAPAASFVPLEGDSSRLALPGGVEINYISVSGRQKAPIQKVLIVFTPSHQRDEVDFSFRNSLKDYHGLRLEAGSGLLRDLQVLKDD